MQKASKNKNITKYILITFRYIPLNWLNTPAKFLTIDERCHKKHSRSETHFAIKRLISFRNYSIILQKDHQFLPK